MADNKTKTDRLHDLLPKHLNTKTNQNWDGLLSAIGTQDQATADLISEVRKQFFVKTASRPYLDRLAANVKVSRPRLVGMDDSSFREYIPVLSYKPKQVKLIIDQLLDVFFFKESTTAFITSQAAAPFSMQSGWELGYLVDENNAESILFRSTDFTDITAATANEVVAAINRQAKHSYATVYFDSVTKNSYIRIFTKTIGTKGSLRLEGGRANVVLKFNGFIDTAGNGSNTEWTVTKVGDQVTFQHTAGTAPGLDQVVADDIVIVNITGNIGSFIVKEVDLSNNRFIFTNLFGTPGTYTQTSAEQVKFIRPNKYVAYTNKRRAMTWETSPNEIVVEMPTSPPVVKRSLKGSLHLNGAFSPMTARVSSTSLTVQDASGFPDAGTFWLEPMNEIKSRYLTSDENTVVSKQISTRLEGTSQLYTYTSRTVLSTTGNIVAGQTQITNLASTVGLAVGQSVFMQGVPGYAEVTNIAGSIVDISAAATETASGRSVKFGGNTLTGISPDLPALASLNEYTLASLSRTSNVVTGTTSSAHGYIVGEQVIVSGASGIPVLTTTGDITNGSNQLINLASVTGVAPGLIVSGTGIPTGTTIIGVAGNTVTLSTNATATTVGLSVTFKEDLNGTFILTSASGTTFTYTLLGTNGTSATPGTARVERVGLANSGSKIILTGAVSNLSSRITGSYVWDLSAPFVLSSKKANIVESIQAGKVVRLLTLNDNDISSNGGYVIFDYGLNSQEGPVRYLYKPTSNTIAIDPSYVFQFNHSANASIVAINNKGPHRMSTRGEEYAPYVTNPSEARVIMQELIKSVKSAGIFVNFLIRYPEQLYATLDVYESGSDPG